MLFAMFLNFCQAYSTGEHNREKSTFKTFSTSRKRFILLYISNIVNYRHQKMEEV